MYTGKIEFSHLGSKEIRISETRQSLCNFYSLKPCSKKKKSITHHILLVDVSLSMTSEIPTLKDKLIETLNIFLTTPNNYVSVILYSGHGECYRILSGVKCDKISYNIAQVYSIIEKELYTRGVTVMSEPLETSLNIVESLISICNKHNIVLFTDGCLVPTNWSHIDEEEKCFSLALHCKEKNVFLNTIGFGSYYDRSFLQNLTEVCGTGFFSHIDEIEDYTSTVMNFVDLAHKKELISLKLSGTEYFVVDSSQILKGENELTSIQLGCNNLIVSLEDNLSLIHDNIKLSSKKLTSSHIDDFLYSISLLHIKNEDIDSAEVTIAQTGNIVAYSQIANCYSFVEKGKSIQLLNKLLNNKAERNKFPRQVISVPTIETEPLCFLEVIEEIINTPNTMLLWNKSYKYKRIGVKSKSLNDALKFIPSSDEYGRIVNLSIGSSKLNIGVKVLIDGCVQNSKSKLKLDCKIYKDYNIFLNGNINTKLLWCALPKKLRDKYKKEGFILKNKKWNNKMVSILDLTKLKATNKRTFKRFTSEEISSMLFDIEVLSCKQWALNSVIKDIQEKYSLNKLDTSCMCLEEKEARLNFKVDMNGIYSSSQVQSDTFSPYEVYSANYLEWRIEKFPKKKYKDDFKLEFEGLINENNILESYTTLLSLLDETRNQLRNLEFKVNIVRISSSLCHKSLFMWNDEYSKDKKQTDKVLNTNMVVGGVTNISIKNMENYSIRQDKYSILTKCN
ncbi:MAG: hypothetical protein ACRC7N_12855 [Clostridium sp.]